MENQVHVKVTQYADRRYLIMYYVDPVTEKRVTRSTRKTLRREAEREAAKWEAELREGRYQSDARMTWLEFRRKYEDEKLVSLALNTQGATAAAMNHLERVLDPARLASITAATLSEFQARLRKEGMKDTTLDAHLGHLQAVLGWAESMGLLPKRPKMHRPQRVKGRKLMRGRPITAEEFDRMLLAVPKVRKGDAPAWHHYLTGLWLSGLRLEESLALSWDGDEAFIVDFGGRRPRFRIYAEAEKGHQDRILPLTPDFAEFLLQTPQEAREGAVFNLIGNTTGKPLSPKRVCRIVSAIGRAAKVVVNKTEGKFATAHDLRRSFGTRWAPRVKPATLQKLMRHASIQTTLKYYVELDADEMAEELWQAHGSINTFINSGPNTTPHFSEAPVVRKPQPLTEQEV